jgi:hypothetical protein
MGDATAPAKCKPISVSFQVLTGDQLKQIIFGLNKGCNPDDTSFWTIHFELQERATTSDTFVVRVKLDISVAQQNQSGAQTTANNGLNSAQTDHLLGPGQSAAQLQSSGAITEDQLGDVVQQTVTMA